MTTAAANGNALLDAHVRLIRDTADLVEASGIPGLVLCPDQDEIVIQVPQAAGDDAARARTVARLADLTGGIAAPDPRPGTTQGWIRAAGVFAGHPVRIYTAIAREETP
ncbi:MAG TPA: hypothetical protein VKH61_16420 [Streptosporangiaceae bacterium]|nr:hypothetical protein [Streptosporangiaceae bacterium]